MELLHFKPALLAALPEEDAERIAVAIRAIVCLLCDNAEDYQNFAFDESSIAAIQERLDSKYKSRTLKWDEGYNLTRVMTSSGHASSSKKQIDVLETMLNAHGILYAYCIANITGQTLFLHPDGALALKLENVDGLICFPTGKVLKYLKNGEEDSLVGFLNIIKSGTKAEALAMREKLRAMLESLGTALPENHKFQEWYDTDTGELLRVMVIDTDTGKAFAQVAFATEEEVDGVLERVLH